MASIVNIPVCIVSDDILFQIEEIPIPIIPDNYIILIHDIAIAIYNPQNEMFQRFKTKCSFLQNEAYLCKSFFLP